MLIPRLGSAAVMEVNSGTPRGVIKELKISKNKNDYSSFISNNSLEPKTIVKIYKKKSAIVPTVNV